MHVDSDNLNDVMEIDHVIRVNPDLTVDTSVADVHAPECVIETADDDCGSILAEHEKTFSEYMTSQGWELIDGFSGQSGYSGPIMHASEYIGGHLANHILDNPGLYVACTVETLDDSDDAAGWVVLRRDVDNPSVSYRCPCCGDDVMGTRPVCSDCELAGCERTTSCGVRAYSNCQRSDTNE